jgi:hypothetical protein
MKLNLMCFVTLLMPLVSINDGHPNLPKWGTNLLVLKTSEYD